MALSTRPPVFDQNDVAGTMKKVCDYLQQLHEELDFTLKQIEKTIKTTGKQ